MTEKLCVWWAEKWRAHRHLDINGSLKPVYRVWRANTYWFEIDAFLHEKIKHIRRVSLNNGKTFKLFFNYNRTPYMSFIVRKLCADICTIIIMLQICIRLENALIRIWLIDFYKFGNIVCKIIHRHARNKLSSIAVEHKKVKQSRFQRQLNL